jgi:hypothetical protein
MRARAQNLKIEGFVFVIIAKPVGGGATGITVQVVFCRQGAGWFFPGFECAVAPGNAIIVYNLAMFFQQTFAIEVVCIRRTVFARCKWPVKFVRIFKTPGVEQWRAISAVGSRNTTVKVEM